MNIGQIIEIIISTIAITSYIALGYYTTRFVKKKLLITTQLFKMIIVSFMYALFFGIGILSAGYGEPGFALPAPVIFAFIFSILLWVPVSIFIKGVVMPFLFWWMLIFLVSFIKLKLRKIKGKILLFIVQIFLFLSCNINNSENKNENNLLAQNIPIPTETQFNPLGSTIETRFLPPEGFKRIKAEPNSFAEYLRKLPLKPHNTFVRYYEGTVKPNNHTYEAVVDLPIGNKDLHQCADAIIRLRAEYLWHQKQYDKIHFNFTNGFRVDYSEWMKGKRIVVKENKTSWTSAGNSSNKYADFWNYMETIFTYAGTLSLSKELSSTNIEDLKIGDIFIQGGSPGHAVIVVDMAENPQTNERLFMLAQSYMPAQEIQILQNVDDKSISPWYSTNFDNELNTPEWLFYKSNLKRFHEQLNTL